MLPGLLAVTTFQKPERPLLLIHVMPWFQRDQPSEDNEKLGWHWRMNKTSDELLKAGNVASHFHPLTGPYDSTDPDLLDLQIALIKRAGFDGVLADWYGQQNFWDYAFVDVATDALFRKATAAGLKIGVVYEDQSIGNPIREKLADDSQKTSLIQSAASRLKPWMAQPNFIRKDGKPLVFVFGPQFFKADDWTTFRQTAGDFTLLGLHYRRPDTDGVYDWPLPSKGIAQQTDFWNVNKSETNLVPVAYPRFDDFYKEGGQPGYPKIPDNNGKTLQTTLDLALKHNPFAIQVATWNDWQEGTQIEPSTEFKYRDLITVQDARRKIDPKFPFTAKDFEAPYKTYLTKKKSR